MYTLAADFSFKKTINTYLKLEIRVMITCIIFVHQKY